MVLKNKPLHLHCQSMTNGPGRFPESKDKGDMKTTCKNLVEFFKATKGEYNFSVISFNPTTKTREMAMGGFELMHALSTFSTEGAKGRICILTNKAGWDYMNKFESENHRRVKFDDMKEYRMIVDEYSHEYESGSFIL